MATKGAEGNGHNNDHYCDSRLDTRVRGGRLLLEGAATVGNSWSGTDEERAKQILFQYTDKDFSFADATSFSMSEVKQKSL